MMTSDDAGAPRSTLVTSAAMRAAVLDEAELAGCREHAPDQVAVVLQGTLEAGDVVEGGRDHRPGQG
jgi:hypothetical protein